MNLNHRSKYSLVASAVALACAVGADQSANAASVVAGATVTVAQQFVAAATSSLGVTVTFGAATGANYVSGDRIKLSVSGAEFLTSSAIASPNATTTVTTTVSSNSTTVTTTQTCANVDVIGYADATNANFRMSGSLASGSTCYFTIPLKASTIASTGASISFSSQFSTGESLEAAVSRGVVATADQFSASVVKALAGVVDVEKARYHFAADDTNAASTLTGNESQLVVSLGNATAGVLAGQALVKDVTIRVVGAGAGFTWLDDTSSGFGTCAASDLTAGNAQAVLASTGVGGGVAAVPSLSCVTLSYVISAASGQFTGGLVTIALGRADANTATTGAYDRTIPAPQSYTTSIDFSYYQSSVAAATSVTELASTSAGSFTLNGSTIYVPFLPYNSSTTRTVYLSNRSDQAGGVSFSAIADGTQAACASSNFPAVSAKANGVTLLTTAIDAGIAACYGANYDGKVSLTIVASIPGGKSDLFSGYNRGGALMSVPNSSSGRDSSTAANRN